MVTLWLVGMMGSGKTAVGRIVARGLGLPFVDLDDAVTRRACRSVPRLFADEGEAGFRRREADELSRVAGAPAAVVATGGGAVLDAGNRRRMRSRGLVIWLTASPEVLAARVGEDPGRPLLGGDPRRHLERLAARRAAAYRAAAHLVVETDGRSPEEVAAEVMSRCGV